MPSESGLPEADGAEMPGQFDSMRCAVFTAAPGIFLHERVDHRRWTAALLVAAGVVLMAL